MQGKQRLQQALYVSLDLDAFIPQDHRLRKIDRVLDLSFIRDLTSNRYCSDDGRPSIDPVVYFKMQIIKYLYGIPSDRQLCSDIHVNLAFRWFLRFSIEDKTPTHSAMSKIRDRFGEELFKDVFEKIVEQCKKAGLVKGKQMVTDATLIEADAAIKSIVKNEDLGKSAAQLKAERKARAEELAKTGTPPKHKKKKCSAETHTSRTDVDATMVSRSGHRPHLYYKSHCTIDGDSRVITDCHVTTGSTHECTVFKDRAEYVMKRFGLKPNEWLADRGYGHGPAYEYLRSKKICAYIPLRDKKLGRGKHAPTEGFRYDRKNDIYRCPRGHKMFPHKPANGFTRYRITGSECGTCPLRAKCLGTSKLGSKRIQRAVHQDEFDRLHRRSETKNFKKKIRQRSFKIEGIFGEDKENHQLSRAHYRRRWKMQVQVYLISAVHNLKRLAQHTDSAIIIFVFRLRTIVPANSAMRFFGQEFEEMAA